MLDSGNFDLREFGYLPSSWPPARVGGGSDLAFAAPFPEDLVDPADPAMSSKKAMFV